MTKFLIRRSFPLVTLLLATIASAQQPDSPPGSLARYISEGKLTPEFAASSPPLAQLSHLKDTRVYTDFRDMQYDWAAETAYLAKYASQLATLTDRKITDAPAIRVKLNKLILDISAYTCRLDGGRHSYDISSTPAYAEWLLYSSRPEFFLPIQTPATANDRVAPISQEEIKTFLRLITYSRHDLSIGFPEEILKNINNEIMKQLTEFESHLNEAGKQYFRTELVHFIDRSFR